MSDRALTFEQHDRTLHFAYQPDGCMVGYIALSQKHAHVWEAYIEGEGRAFVFVDSAPRLGAAKRLLVKHWAAA